jgi:hypothetical protein
MIKVIFFMIFFINSIQPRGWEHRYIITKRGWIEKNGKEKSNRGGKKQNFQHYNGFPKTLYFIFFDGVYKVYKIIKIEKNEKEKRNTLTH